MARAENVTVEGPQAVLVSNNQDGMGDIAELGRRARLDRGTLGMFAVTVSSAAQAAGLLREAEFARLTRLVAQEVVVEARRPRSRSGSTGRPCSWTPRCAARQPAALRVRVPRDRPGVPDPTPVMDWNRLADGLTMRYRPWMTAPVSGADAPAAICGGAIGELDQIDQATYSDPGDVVASLDLA